MTIPVCFINPSPRHGRSRTDRNTRGGRYLGADRRGKAAGAGRVERALPVAERALRGKGGESYAATRRGKGYRARSYDALVAGADSEYRVFRALHPYSR